MRLVLLGMVDQVPHAVGEVVGGSAQWEQGQVQVTSGFGQRMEEQPQLQHRVAWRLEGITLSAVVRFNVVPNVTSHYK